MIRAIPKTPSALQVPAGPGRLATALEILTVAASLALGVAFVGSLWPAPSAPAAEVARTCPPGSATC